MPLKEHFLPQGVAIKSFTDQSLNLLERSETHGYNWLENYRTLSGFAEMVDILHPCTLGIYLLAKAWEFTEERGNGRSYMDSAAIGFSILSKAKAVKSASAEFMTANPGILSSQGFIDFQDRLVMHGSTGRYEDQATAARAFNEIWGKFDTKIGESKPDKTAALVSFIELVKEKHRLAKASNILYSHARDAEKMGVPAQFLDFVSGNHEGMKYYQKAYDQSFLDLQLLLDALNQI